jgi:hypothetical protein
MEGIRRVESRDRCVEQSLVLSFGYRTGELGQTHTVVQIAIPHSCERLSVDGNSGNPNEGGTYIRGIDGFKNGNIVNRREDCGVWRTDTA